MTYDMFGPVHLQHLAAAYSLDPSFSCGVKLSQVNYFSFSRGVFSFSDQPNQRLPHCHTQLSVCLSVRLSVS